MASLGVVESLGVKAAAVASAAEAAEMLLRVDDIVRAPPRPRERDTHPC